MNAPVDVLAYFQRIADNDGDIELLALNARDAVAELIAACDAEQMVINDYLLNPCKETCEAYQPAMMRRRAALARVKGHKA